MKYGTLQKLSIRNSGYILSKVSKKIDKKSTFYMAIIFTEADIQYRILQPQKVKKWLSSIVLSESKQLGAIAIVWCSDEYLLGVNRQYLQHDYFTDIITFDYSENSTVSGDLMISLDTVKNNAEEFGVVFHVEQLRVLAHGILHLCGYGDSTEQEQAVMRAKEEFYMAQF